MDPVLAKAYIKAMERVALWFYAQRQAAPTPPVILLSISHNI